MPPTIAPPDMAPSRPRRVVIVAGPTASGKSALALALAQRLGGTIVNADAMQCYANLRVLTARPTAADEAAIPHILYGVADAAFPVTTAWWREAALAQLAAIPGPVIFCGGTFLYLQTLRAGLAAIPPPGATARTQARALLAAIGPEALHARLAAQDPATAATLRPSDSQRLARAYEVLLATGQGLAAWHANQPPTPPVIDPLVIQLAPDRASLRAAIATRFAAMLDAGALDEARALLALHLPPDTPLLRAHGVPELGAFLRNELTLSESARRAITAIGQYTRRQATWLRHRPLADPTHTITIPARFTNDAQLSCVNIPDMRRFLSEPD